MAKPVKNKTFYVIIHEENYLGKFPTINAAKDQCDKEEWEGAIILEVSNMWSSGYPPEPEIEFWEASYDDL